MPAVSPEKEGPIPARKCRDLPFLALFIAFWIGMFIISGFAFNNGNFLRLKYGTDSFGNLCGTKNTGFPDAIDASNLPFLFFAEPWSTSDSPKLCVSSCPASSGNANGMVCMYGYTPSASNLANHKCFWPIASKPILFRCVPSAFMTFNTAGVSDSSNPDQHSIADSQANGELNARNVASQIWADVSTTWPIICICAGVAILLSFVWLLLIRWFAWFVTWITILAANLSGIALSAYFWYSFYCAFKNQPNQAMLYTGYSQLDAALYNRDTLLGLAIICSGITLFIVTLTLLARKRISIAIAVIGEASAVLRTIPSLLFLPFLKNLFIAIVFAWCLTVLLLLASSGTNIATAVAVAGETHTGQQFKPSTVLNFLQIYYVFGFFWAYWLIVAILQTTIAGAVGVWYWTLDRSRKGLPVFIVLQSFLRVIRYSLGSLAFGSLLLAITSTIRVVLSYLQHQAKKGPKNKLLSGVLACLSCCMACFEKFLAFLNSNAYIEVAVYGTSFFGGARRAFGLMIRNAFRVLVITQVSNVILFMGKAMIVLITTVLSLFLAQNPQFLAAINEDIGGRYWAVTVIIVVVLSYMLASTFTSVLQMVINTIFLCFCEDCERNDGSAEKPYYMPPSLCALVSSVAGPTVPNRSDSPSKIVVHKTEKQVSPETTQSRAYY